MLSVCCSNSLANKRPLLLSLPACRIGVPNRQPSSSLVLPSSARLLHFCCNSSRSSWRISRFRDQDRDWQVCSVPGNDNVIPEECVKHGRNNEVAVKRDWKARFREASHVFFRAIGKRWSVPWTAETVLQRMLPLVFLGTVMGVLFTRSRNLVPSMLLHSLWNAFVFASLIR